MTVGFVRADSPGAIRGELALCELRNRFSSSAARKFSDTRFAPDRFIAPKNQRENDMEFPSTYQRWPVITPKQMAVVATGQHQSGAARL